MTFTTGGRGIYPEGDEADILKGNIGPVPKSLAAFLLTVAVGQLILSYTRFGRHIVMVGSNMRAAEAAGIDTLEDGHRRLHRRRAVHRLFRRV